MAFLRQIAIFWLLLPGLSLSAFSQTVESGKREVQLIELYTSEGCSSCPPADRWLTSLLRDPGLWKDFVPIAFHVDYWNGLGWPDPFAKAEFSERQRIYQQQGNVATVYTPGFVIQGDEWRGWFRNLNLPPKPTREVGNLSMSLTENQALVQIKPEINIQGGMLHFAWLGFGYERRIARGENAGKTLREDFVVLDVQHKPAESGENQLRAEFGLQKPEAGQGHKLALVAWFSAPGNQRPIQAVGTWYPVEALSEDSKRSLGTNPVILHLVSERQLSRSRLPAAD
jgi:hypothetical protein